MNYWAKKLCVGVWLLLGLLTSAHAGYVDGNPLNFSDPAGLAPQKGLQRPIDLLPLDGAGGGGGGVGGRSLFGAKSNVTAPRCPGSDSQFGTKYGEHRSPELSGYRTAQEYRELADRLYSDTASTRVTYPANAQRYPGETHITDGAGNILRLDPQGNFRSMYPIK